MNDEHQARAADRSDGRSRWDAGTLAELWARIDARDTRVDKATVKRVIEVMRHESHVDDRTA